MFLLICFSTRKEVVLLLLRVHPLDGLTLKFWYFIVPSVDTLVGGRLCHFLLTGSLDD